MMEAEVIKVYRKNNKIIGYKIQNDLGDNRSIEANTLKKAIKEEKINLTNYKLTSNNRLIKRRVPTNSNSLYGYILMNKDTKVAKFDFIHGIQKKYTRLPYGFTSIQNWIGIRAKFSCAKNVQNFFSLIGIKDIEDFILKKRET